MINKGTYKTTRRIVSQKTPVKEQTPTQESVDLQNVIIRYAEYYEAKLRRENYDEEQISEIIFQWIEDTISYYKSNFSDNLRLVIANYESMINEEEKKGTTYNK